MSGRGGNNIPNQGEPGDAGHFPDFGASRGEGRRVFGAAHRDSRRKLIHPRTANFSNLKLKQESDFECTVMIWRTAEGFTGGLRHPGHASFLMRKTRNEGPFTLDDYDEACYDNHSAVRYVSFWPGTTNVAEAKTRFDLAIKGNIRNARMKQNGYFRGHHLDDYTAEIGRRAIERLDDGMARRQGQVLLWSGLIEDPKTGLNVPAERYGQAPQELIHLPGIVGSRPTQLGIQMNRIVDWCHDFKASKDFNYQYISTSNNCAGVACRALAAGGADAFAGVGGCSRESSIFFTPNDAETWVKAVRGGIFQVNVWLSMLNANSPRASVWRENLPTVAQWKRESYKTFSFRGSETRGVDEALAVWHACDIGENSKSFPKAFDALVKLAKHTFTHMRKDPNSDRSEAYKELARSILTRVSYLAKMENGPFDALYFGDDW